MENITLYEDQNYTKPVVVSIANFNGVNSTAGTTYEQTFGEGDEQITIKYHQGNEASPTLAFLEDSQPLVQYQAAVPGQTPRITPDWHEKAFYIKPNMRINITMYVDDNKIYYGAKFFVGGIELTQATINANEGPPAPNRGIRFCQTRRDDETSIGIYIRTGDTSMVLGWVSEKFWDGSLNIHAKSKNNNATKGGYGGARGLQNNDREPQNIFESINVINISQGSAGVHVYELTDAQMTTFQNKLWDKITSFWTTQIQGCNPIQGVLSCHLLPIAVTGSQTGTNYVRLTGGKLDLASDVKRVSKQMQEVGPWTIDLDAGTLFTQSYLDYAPYISATLELPFIGIIPIDVNQIMDGSLTVRYIFDVLTGNCLAEVYIKDRTGNKCLYGRYGGNGSYQFPLTADVNGGHHLPTLFAGAATAGMGLATGNPIAIFSGVSTALQGNQAEMASVGTLSANIGCLAGDLMVRLHLTIKDDLTIIDGNNDMLQQILGLPAGCYAKVENFKGTYVQGEIKCDNLDVATDAEKEAIISLFARGVYA